MWHFATESGKSKGQMAPFVCLFASNADPAARNSPWPETPHGRRIPTHENAVYVWYTIGV